MQTSLSQFVTKQRKALGLTQPELAAQSGLGLRFIREVEAGKPTLRLDKVNQLLAFWGHTLVPEPLPRHQP